MGKALQANKIALGLLHRANRDLHTSRSFEIPACGGFMLAERTAEHQEYFAEDREAVYFDTFDELMDKIRYYLRHDAARTRIAADGYRRCLHSGYRYVDRARELLGRLRA
jgi:spore maturation protein CgeB